MLISIILSSGCCLADLWVEDLCAAQAISHIFVKHSSGFIDCGQVYVTVDVFLADESWCIRYGLQHLGMKSFHYSDVGFRWSSPELYTICPHRVEDSIVH